MGGLLLPKVSITIIIITVGKRSRDYLMRTNDVYYSNFASTAKFKVLSDKEVDEFVKKYSDLPKINYIGLVLEVCLFNLKTDIVSALRKMSKMAVDEALMSLYNGCIMLNPRLDEETWLNLTTSYNYFEQGEKLPAPSIGTLPNETMPPPKTATAPATSKRKVNSNSRAKFLNLSRHLNDKIIGQPEAIEKICLSLKRAQANLNDENRPLGVFLFCGPSGVGKTLIAKELQKYLFDSPELVRIDCGEYQHKHENQKLNGSPPGFVGHEEGGQLTKMVSKTPNTVVLLDEAEKAHPDFWNTFLKVFDDGFMTDNKGNHVSFKNTIIIITSNLGNDDISKEAYSRSAGFRASITDSYDSKVAPKRDMVERMTMESVRKFFKPEFLNRLDDIIVFNHLDPEDFERIADLEMQLLASKLSKQSYVLNWDEDVIKLLVESSGRSMEGARGLARVRRDRIENRLADLLLNRRHPKGTIFNVSVEEDDFEVN